MFNMPQMQTETLLAAVMPNTPRRGHSAMLRAILAAMPMELFTMGRRVS